MLTPDQLEALPRRFVQLWQQVEDDILQDIARRMKSLGELDPLTPTAIWQAWRLAETRAVRSNTVATLARYTGKSRAEIKRLLETAGAQTLAADDAVYTAAGLDPPPVEQSPALLNLLNAGYRQTCGTWQNLTATTANTVTGAFEDRLSRAWGLISTGAMDYNTAIRRTVDDLA
uniref:phage minor capsid protein n=1 Tax=Faecalibacterium sp. TaxID=1971605 RepID=UPI00402500D4